MVFKKNMLQADDAELLNPLIRKVHYSERQNLQFPLQVMP